MPEADLQLENRLLRMEGDYTVEGLFVKSAKVVEKMSALTETTIEFITKDKTLELQKVVGSRITLCLDDPDREERTFTGRCISAEFIGLSQGQGHFMAHVRPFFWFLTRGIESRVFQDMSTPEIIKAIIGDHGFGSDLQDKLSETYLKRTYCVQYRESDFDFLSRLMEEDGIYYHFVESDKKEQMVLADGIGAHAAVPGSPSINFKFRQSESYRRNEDHIFEWNAVESQTPGKVTLDDWDFVRPNADLKQSKSIEKGSHTFKSHEAYQHVGHLRDNVMDDPKNEPTTDIDAAAERKTRVMMESVAVDHVRWRGVGNVRNMANGQTFTLNDHPRVNDDKEFLIVEATHHLSIESDYEDDDTENASLDERLEKDDENTDVYRCEFEVIPKTNPFRAKLATHWPEISGIETAIVTGPPGEEIHTDTFGRIKVQFHWDRLGENNHNSSCWVRCMMPWTGKGWGMISVPRIGQEVVIQFEQGDPDRPICIGMLFNDNTMPAYPLPDNMTQTGIVTRSTKGGSVDTFNELIFEDRIDEEFVRLQSEKDYKETIKNNAEITIGMEKMDPGDLTQTIYHTKTETIKTGDHVFTVEEGNQTVFVKTDHAETVEGKSNVEITGDYVQTISEGNVNRTVSSGDESLTVSAGNYSLDTTAGKIEVTAAQSIELSVGANSILIDQSGITISGTMISIEGTTTLDAKSKTTTVKGDVLLVLKGGLTTVN